MTFLMRCTKNRQILNIWAIAFLVSLASTQALAKSEPYVPFKTSGRVIKNHDCDTIKLQTTDHAC